VLFFIDYALLRTVDSNLQIHFWLVPFLTQLFQWVRRMGEMP
jgi:hypothetical protein